MLHIQVLVCVTYHLHVSMPVASRVLLQLCACRKKRLLCCLCSCTLSARGYTPRLHLNVVAELPGYPVCFTQVKVTGDFLRYTTLW